MTSGKSPSFSWYPDKWIADTRRLSILAKGVYHEFLMVAWLQFQNDDCAVPDDDDFIAGEIGVSIDDWKRARVEIMNPHRPLLIAKNGRLLNNGLLKSKLKRDAFRKKQSQNGRSGGRPKGSKNKENKPRPFFEESQTKAKKSLPIPIPISIPDNNTTPVLDMKVALSPSARRDDEQAKQWTVRGYLEKLKLEPAYRHIDPEIEESKIKVWKAREKNRLRQITEKFLQNWADKVERPLNIETGGTNGKAKNNPTLTALDAWKAGKPRDCPDAAAPTDGTGTDAAEV